MQIRVGTPEDRCRTVSRTAPLGELHASPLPIRHRTSYSMYWRPCRIARARVLRCQAHGRACLRSPSGALLPRGVQFAHRALSTQRGCGAGPEVVVALFARHTTSCGLFIHVCASVALHWRSCKPDHTRGDHAHGPGSAGVCLGGTPAPTVHVATAAAASPVSSRPCGRAPLRLPLLPALTVWHVPYGVAHFVPSGKTTGEKALKPSAGLHDSVLLCPDDNQQRGAYSVATLCADAPEPVSGSTIVRVRGAEGHQYDSVPSCMIMRIDTLATELLRAASGAPMCLRCVH